MFFLHTTLQKAQVDGSWAASLLLENFEFFRVIFISNNYTISRHRKEKFAALRLCGQFINLHM